MYIVNYIHDIKEHTKGKFQIMGLEVADALLVELGICVCVYHEGVCVCMCLCV